MTERETREAGWTETGGIVADGGAKGPATLRIEVEDGAGKIGRVYQGDHIEVLSQERMGGLRRQVNILIEGQRPREAEEVEVSNEENQRYRGEGMAQRIPSLRDLGLGGGGISSGGSSTLRPRGPDRLAETGAGNVARGIDELANTVGALQKSVALLEERLNPVLLDLGVAVDRGALNKVGMGMPEPVRSGVGLRLAELDGRLQGVLSRVAEMTGRLDL